jgi:hypothetical protein
MAVVFFFINFCGDMFHARHISGQMQTFPESFIKRKKLLCFICKDRWKTQNKYKDPAENILLLDLFFRDGS